MNMLMYGAGNIGRGFIGPLFSQAGYNVVFVDVNTELVGALNERTSYPLRFLGGQRREETIKNVRAVDGRDGAAVIGEIAECAIMAVSLGSRALELVAPLIADGLLSRYRTGGGTLDILICENLKDAAGYLRQRLAESLPEDARDAVLARTGLVETSIGRMVPVMTPEAQEGDILRVCVEEYGHLPVDRDAFVGKIPDFDMLVPYSPFGFYEERKLYIHNMGHAMTAYLGRDNTFVWQAAQNPYVRILTQSAMTESAAMLSDKYGVPFKLIYANVEDLLLRFQNRALGDTTERVGRDPMRKLERSDRLVGAAYCCLERGIFPVFICAGIASALYAVDKNEREAVIRDVCRLDGILLEAVREALPLFDGQRELFEVISWAEGKKKALRGSVV